MRIEAVAIAPVAPYEAVRRLREAAAVARAQGAALWLGRIARSLSDVAAQSDHGPA
ncbi:hypothetical protein [Methylobrevis pamukkalensis]|uniref:hypothetical protein n=1 Tax=Methylobrevis pamukkalensis TaxID=1439726 RepID=UPI00147203F9|nr:hypothetical protein [Methylobrevis pamukkalensis]